MARESAAWSGEAQERHDHFGRMRFSSVVRRSGHSAKLVDRRCGKGQRSLGPEPHDLGAGMEIAAHAVSLEVWVVRQVTRRTIDFELAPAVLEEPDRLEK